ncbi:carotenoid biosynthesis protein [Paenibacillus sp. CGMCC 1.18879]|uniref:carotenoid biosynthesis protein n=1 Tax=Paenibacillus sp. CGMCC 1.18879 TaxID=2834466 RepID=UPI001CA8331C|nr:carotenoid biosynthesis protein [Paenibacillus sp. CGMCC 1.18879]MBY9079512.1 carotenoid biosynthesis protein [Paenibacillus sp. CGMCC 1.18879]
MDAGKDIKNKSLLWLLLLCGIAIAVIQGLRVNEFINVNGMSMLVIVGLIFTFNHGIRRYGFKDFFVFLVITLIIAGFYENLSIATTFPFGAYHYTDSLGPKIIYTPVIINFAYFQMAYVAWNLAGLLINSFDNRLKGIYIFLQPLLGMFTMVMWDVVFDPYMSTILHHWEWEKGGSYFGVPFQNFMGWALTVYTIFQLFAFYISKKSTIPTPGFVLKKEYWAQFVTMYLIWPLSFIIMGLCISPSEVTALNGQIWNVKNILETAGLVGLFTMSFVGLLSILKVYVIDKNQFFDRNMQEQVDHLDKKTMNVR